jgi:F-type H+-transporting ATPase subunit b
MELLTPNVGLLAWMLIVFGLLFFLLSKFAWKPIVAGLKEREESIDSALRMAEETRAEMAALKADNDKAKAEARAERDSILKEAKETANKMVADAKEAARLAGEAEINKASEAIRGERIALMAQMRKDVSELSVEIAEKILRRELADKSASEKLVSSLLSESKLN